MLAISIQTPHIHNIMSGKKTMEVRIWQTRHRGALLLVCSRRPEHPDSGLAIGMADISGIRPMRPDDVTAAMTPFVAGHYVWLLENVRAIAPFPVRGRLGLYEVLTDGIAGATASAE